MIDGFEIAEQVKMRRKRLGLTQGDLAMRAETSLQTIVRIERGDAPSVSFGTVVRVLNALSFNLYIELGVSTGEELASLDELADRFVNKYFKG